MCAATDRGMALLDLNTASCANQNGVMWLQSLVIVLCRQYISCMLYGSAMLAP